MDSRNGPPVIWTGNRAYTKVRNYIINAFFSMSFSDLVSLSNLYGEEYGYNASNYLLDTYSSWKDGSVRMSYQSINRILEYVPKFLSVEQQFQLLQYYVNESLTDKFPLIEKSNSKEQNQTVNASNLCDALTKLLIELENTDKNSIKMDWFVEGIFKDKEIVEFTKVLLFTQADQIKRLYLNISNDLQYLETIPYPSNYNLIIHEYIVNHLNINLIIDTFIIPSPSTLNKYALIEEPRLVTQYKGQYNSILLDYTIKVHVEEIKKSTRLELTKLDVNRLQYILSDINKSDEFESKFEVSGQGGTIKFKAWKKNVTKLKLQLLYWYLSIPLWCGSAMAFPWIVIQRLEEQAVLLALPGLSLIYFLIAKPVKVINRLTLEIDNERRKNILESNNV